MPSQHTTEEGTNQVVGIVVPLELEGLCILRQEVQADGKLRKEELSAEEEQSRTSLAQAFPEINVAWQLKEDLHLVWDRLV